MNCHEARKWISPYLDSELDASVTFEVGQHLEQCPGCRGRFEQEAGAERLLAERLRTCPPVVDWEPVTRAVLLPRRLRLWGSLGAVAAACIALVLFRPGQLAEPANAAQWAAQELQRLSPDCAPFDERQRCTSGELQDLSRRVLACDFPLDLAAHTALQVVGVLERVGPDGRSRVEVRLNCCGKPVLLTAARCDCLGELSAVRTAVDGCQRPCWTSSTVCNGLKYDVAAARRAGVVLVAVSPGPHDIRHLLGG